MMKKLTLLFMLMVCMPVVAQNKKPSTGAAHSRPAQPNAQGKKTQISSEQPKKETTKSEEVRLEKEEIPAMVLQDNGKSSFGEWFKRINSFEEGIVPPRFSNYYEATLGVGLKDNYTFLGFSYAHIPKKVGINASLVKGVGTSSISLMVGPTYRLSNAGRGWQVFAGIGGTLAGSTSLALHGGARYAFDKGDLRGTETLSLTGSLQYVNRELVPTFGISVIPATKKIEGWWGEKERRFPHHYTEAIASFGNDDFLLGTNYTYIPSKVGPYISGMMGDGLYTVNLGGALRLTNSNSTGVDVQMFQGVGLCNGDIGGETGIRLGFGGRDESKFGWWSLCLAANYSENYVGVTAGLSWPIVGIAAVAVGMVAVGYIMSNVGSPGTTPSSVGSSGSSTSGSSTPGSSEKCKVCLGSGNCSSSDAVASSKYYCHGSGKCGYCSGGVYYYGGTESVCTTCNGNGKCKYCKGTGKCKGCNGSGKK